MKSVVKWFNNQKGIGFILGTEEVQEDILVHYSTILQPKEGFKSLIKDEVVEFDVVKTRFGYRAKNVVSLKENVCMEYEVNLKKGDLLCREQELETKN